MNTNSFYSEDIAYVHATAYEKFASHAAKDILYKLQKNGIHHGLVIDLGCGSGMVASVLIQHGYNVLGVDISPALIAIAKQRAPQAQFIVGSFYDICLPDCVALVSTSECLNYLPEASHVGSRNNHEKKLKGLFSNVFRALQDGGLFIFDMRSPSAEAVDIKRIVEEKDWTIFTHNTEDMSMKTRTRYITLFREISQGCYRKTQETHYLQLYTCDYIIDLLQQTGFMVETCNAYDDLKLDRNHHIFLCNKTQSR